MNKRQRKTKTPLPVRKTMCDTCPFRPDGWTGVRPLLEERALSQGTPICHSTGKALKREKGKPPQKAHACRGARNLQLNFFYRLGFISAPTDAAWAAKLAELNDDRAASGPASR